MARPQKQTIDYFPHYVSDGKTLLILQNEFENDGYAFWFKLLELLCVSDGQAFNYNSPAEWRLLLAKTHVKEDIATKILAILAEVGAIDNDLYAHKIIWVQKLVDNLDLVYNRRTTGKPQKPVIANINPVMKNVSVDNNPVNVDKSTHTIQNNTKQYNNLPSDISKSLTQLLKNLILENNPIARVPDNLNKWELEIDRMLRIDKRPPELIEKVIRWCQSDTFWKANILSAGTLRDKFDQLLMKMNGGTQNGGTNQNQKRNSREIPEAGQFTSPEDYLAKKQLESDKLRSPNNA
jgi:hypothetical protein